MVTSISGNNLVNKCIHILIADDAPIIRDSLISLLDEEQDFDIIGEAENGMEAYEKAVIEHPDVILMDVNMPILDGIEATKKIKDNLPFIKIIGLSVNNDIHSSQSMLKAGASAYCTKDCDIDDLINIIRNT